MGDVPNKSDIQAIFKRLRSSGENKLCFDCRASNPTWASVTYGVFLCIDCSAVHRSLGVHVTFIRSTQLDTNWTWTQLRAMQVGGNANANAFFRQHGCTSNDAQQKYHSRAASMYKEKLHSLALQAQRRHGSKLHIDAPGHAHETSPITKEVDFFKEHSDTALFSRQTSIPEENSKPIATPNGRSNNGTNAEDDPNHGPNVEHALSTSPSQVVVEPRKSTIGGRKPPSAKKGLGAKKGGLGAQKVKTNFSDLESEAQRRDQEKESWTKQQKINEAKTKEEEEKQLASVRLAYKDLTVESKKREESLKNMDPKKREQVERLGMGFGGDRGVSHSAFSDMKTIDQEMPDRVKSSRSRDRYGESDDRYGNSRDKDFFDDEFEMVSKPPKYKNSPFSSGDDFGWSKSSSSSWDVDRFEKKQSSTIEEIPSHSAEDKRKSRSRKVYEAPACSEDAQKKFGNAKAISSDMFFGDSNKDFETKQSFSRFEGSQSISSADFFGDGRPRPQSSSYSSHDLSDVKDSVKQGVTKVAGKLSNLASGVMSSLQDKYGY